MLVEDWRAVEERAVQALERGEHGSHDGEEGLNPAQPEREVGGEQANQKDVGLSHSQPMLRAPLEPALNPNQLRNGEDRAK